MGDGSVRWPLMPDKCIRSSGTLPLDSTRPGVETLRPKAAVKPLHQIKLSQDLQ